MKKFGLYGLAALLSFMVFLIAYAPASFVLALAQDTLAARAPQLHIDQVSGTLWQGEANLQYENLAPSRLQWHITPATLLKGELHADLQARGHDHNLASQVTWQPSRLSLQNLNGILGSDYINPLAQRYGLQFGGQLDIEDLRFDVIPATGWLDRAAGAAQWSGGRVQFATAYSASPAQAESIMLPPLTAILAQPTTALTLAVTSADAELLSVILKPTGWVEISLQQTLFQIAGIQLPPGATLRGGMPGQTSSNTVVKFEEKLF